MITLYINRDTGGTRILMAYNGQNYTFEADTLAAAEEPISRLVELGRTLLPDQVRQMEAAEQRAMEAEELAAQKEQERADTMAELLAMAEFLYGEGTDTPLPDVPEPGATP